MKLIIDVPDEIVKKGFEEPLTDEERQTIIRSVGNAIHYQVRACSTGNNNNDSLLSDN